MITVQIPALRPMQPPIQWVLGALPGGGGMKLGHEAYHCSSFSAEVKRKWSHTFSPTVYPNEMYMDNFTFTLRINTTCITTQAIQGYFCSS